MKFTALIIRDRIKAKKGKELIMLKHLYLMRHGETEFNLENRVQGWCDSPLTEKGIRQAELARDMLREREITFTHGYSSPLDRTITTLKYTSPNHMPTETVTGLKEWGFGSLEGQSRDLMPKPLSAPKTDDYYCQYGGERASEVCQRINQSLQTIMSKEDSQQVLAVAHGAVIYQFVKDYLPDPVAGIGNCEIFHFVYDFKTFTFIENMKPYREMAVSSENLFAKSDKTL